MQLATRSNDERLRTCARSLGRARFMQLGARGLAFPNARVSRAVPPPQPISLFLLFCSRCWLAPRFGSGMLVFGKASVVLAGIRLEAFRRDGHILSERSVESLAFRPSPVVLTFLQQVGQFCDVRGDPPRFIDRQPVHEATTHGLVFEIHVSQRPTVCIFDNEAFAVLNKTHQGAGSRRGSAGSVTSPPYLGRIFSDRRLFSGASRPTNAGCPLAGDLNYFRRIHGSATTAATKPIPNALTIPSGMRKGAAP